nr:THO complex subunit 5 homolog A [Onthophagus taurus]XP_022916446.1 THO complex subunit 5 homolog A [Onthophagus taurus]
MVKESPNIKKRRKTATAGDGDADGDIYTKVIDFEEKESIQRSAEEDATIYFELCQNIRKFLSNAINLKRENSTESKLMLQQGLTDCCVMIATLKKLNRLDKFRTISARETLNVEKQKVDSTNLQYHNLLYESAHLASEFTKCKQFKSKDENIELISIERFLEVAPESVTSQFNQEQELSDSLKHQLHLAMLEWELTQRKAQAQLCNTLEDEKMSLGGDIIELKNRLDGIGPKLTAVLDASKPLQEYFGLPLDKIQAEHKIARLLPEPLYLLYALSDAYKQVYNIDMTVEVLGDVEEANQWKETHQNIDGKVEIDDEQEETEVEEVVEVIKKRRHRKQSMIDRYEEKKKVLLEGHPLSVRITIVVKPEYVLKVKFVFRPQLGIVTVNSSMDVPNGVTAHTAREVLMGESILNELFENDIGTESPNTSNSYQLQRVGLGSYAGLVPKLGYVYEWAQKICGYDFLNAEKPISKPNPSSVELALKTLYKRLKSRIILADYLQQLESNLIPQIPEGIDHPKNAISTLTKWTSSNWQSFCQLPSAQNLIEAEIVKSTDLFYNLVITRPKASLQAVVVLKNNYPIQAPIFSLTVKYLGEYHSGNSTEVRDMERALNVINEKWKGLSCLLVIQIRHLCAYFDVYLETISGNSGFPQSTVFFQGVCARNRRRPFKYRKIGSGFYTQY